MKDIIKGREKVTLINWSMDEGERGDVVFRGCLDIETLRNIKVDDYQREVAPLTSQKKILDGLRKGSRLPDVQLGMRSEEFYEEDGNIVFTDPVYVIDGLQRISTAIYYHQQNPGVDIHLGATVHLNTTHDWESERFHILNNNRNKVAPSVLLKNMRNHNNAIATLYGLSYNDKTFPLYERVCWSQHMRKGEILTALTLAKVIGKLHSNWGPGRSARLEDVANGLDTTMKKIGMQHMRKNIKLFFDLIDAAWSIRGIQYKQTAIHMREQFLSVLADVLAEHKDFWRKDKELFIDVDLARKIASFPINDPEIIRLASSSGQARALLYDLLVKHINSGKRTKRLKPWNES